MTPQLARLLDTVRRTIFHDLNVAKLCVIVAVNPDTTVSVQPLAVPKLPGRNGALKPVPPQTIPSVPLLFPGGGGPLGSAMVWTPLPGDPVLVVFLDDESKKALSSLAPTPPEIGGKHGPSNGFALPIATPTQIAAATPVADAALVSAALTSMVASINAAIATLNANIATVAAAVPTSPVPPAASVPAPSPVAGTTKVL